MYKSYIKRNFGIQGWLTSKVLMSRNYFMVQFMEKEELRYDACSSGKTLEKIKGSIGG